MRYLCLFVVLFLSCKNDSKSTTELKIVCEVKTTENEEGLDPIIIQTCIFKDYKTMSIGRPDHKGRYSYDYKMFKLTSEKYVEIKNSDIFRNISKLERIINKKLKEEYEVNMKNENIKECMSYIKFRHHKINEMRISFDKFNEVVFNVDYNIPPYCTNVGGSSVVLTKSQIEKYLK